MNYLAHLYLSGKEEKTMVGNFIADHVKGRSFEKFPTDIQKGILLHRSIDFYTDSHPKFREAKKLLQPGFGLYSGIVVDLLYDHFLAQSWERYCDLSLRTFSKRSHAILLINYRYLPKRVQAFLPILIQNRRLESYATVNGIIQSMEIMGRYTSLPRKSEFAKQILLENHPYFHQNFKVFMDDMIQFVTTSHEIKIIRPFAAD